jgi:molybdenum cofactor cytidylyltransferase
VVLLAAGRGERFLAAGGTCHKLQAQLGGMSVLQRSLQAVQASGLPHVVVHAAPELRTMGDSVAHGVQLASTCHPQALGWLLLPADLPLVQPATIARIAQGLSDDVCDGFQALRPVCAGVAGHPVGFAATAFDALQACAGQSGAASVFRDLGGQLVDVDDVGCTRDVDTPQDLAALEAML